MLTLPTGPRGRMMALGLTVSLLVLVWAGVAHPLLTWHAERSEAVEQKRGLVQRLARLSAMLPSLRQQAEALESGGAHGGLLQGSSDALAGAELQGMLERMARDAGLTLSTVETLPVEPVDSYRRIGVRLSANGAWPALIGLLRAVGQAPVSLLVDNVQLHGTAIRGRGDLPPIEAAFTVFGFRVASEASSAPASDRGAKP